MPAAEGTGADKGAPRETRETVRDETSSKLPPPSCGSMLLTTWPACKMTWRRCSWREANRMSAMHRVLVYLVVVVPRVVRVLGVTMTVQQRVPLLQHGVSRKVCVTRWLPRISRQCWCGRGWCGRGVLVLDGMAHRTSVLGAWTQMGARRRKMLPGDDSGTREVGRLLREQGRQRTPFPEQRGMRLM